MRILIYRNGNFRGGASYEHGQILARGGLNLGSTLRRDVVCTMIERAVNDGESSLMLRGNVYTWELVHYPANCRKG